MTERLSRKPWDSEMGANVYEGEENGKHYIRRKIFKRIY